MKLMKTRKPSAFLFSLILLITIAFLTSCVPIQKQKYLQGLTKNDTSSFQEFRNAKISNYKVKPGDNLYIRISSLDPKTYTFFNNEATGGYSSAQYLTNEASIYLNSYMINDTGYIDFPIIGKILVQDQTINQIKDKIQVAVDEYLKETNVQVKLVNFKITMLGQVVRPGKYYVYQDNINIFEALGLAGDATDFANRRKITLVRETDKGSEIHVLDISKRNILASPYYYLKPNDIIYVEPLKEKTWARTAFPYELIFSSITTTIIILQYFR